MHHSVLRPGWKVYLVKENEVYLQVSWRKATPVFQDRCHDSLPSKRVHPIRAPIYKRHRDLRRSVLAMLEDSSNLEPVLPCSFQLHMEVYPWAVQIVPAGGDLSVICPLHILFPWCQCPHHCTCLGCSVEVVEALTHP